MVELSDVFACSVLRSGLELGKSAATRVPDPRGKDSGSKPSADAAKRINQMRDRSRAHVMAGKAVGAHNAGGSNWAGGNDKVRLTAHFRNDGMTGW